MEAFRGWGGREHLEWQRSSKSKRTLLKMELHNPGHKEAPPDLIFLSLTALPHYRFYLVLI
jgi:hypothetical protein